MIHTAEFYGIVENDIIGFLEKRFKTTISLITENIDIDRFYPVKFNFYKLYGVWKFNLIVDFIKLLDKAEISQKDYKEIESKLNNIIINIFGETSKFINIILKRIDYRKDIVVKSDIERKILLKLYKKIRKSVNYKQKISKFDGSIYFSNQSIVINIYDKSKERKEKKLKIETYEKDVLRLEIRLFSKHLTWKKKKEQREKKLENYLKNDLFLEYMEKQLKNILPKGNHFKIETIKKILNNEESIKPKDKKKIIAFLNYISRYGWDSILNLKSESGKAEYSRYTCNKYMKILEELNINPLIIPSREKIDKIENKFWN